MKQASLQMEDCLFFRKQAEECRILARESSDPVLHETLQILLDDCIAYANNTDASLADETWFLSEDAWPVHKNRKVVDWTWSPEQVLGFLLLLAVPSMATLAWTLL
jgi:hypothetical protein